ncbi:MAG TPA: hypothetical protein VJ904_10175 [Tichowtungia sp.]|nr:hypothetical protein [Tichowtungia sp.]
MKRSILIFIVALAAAICSAAENPLEKQLVTVRVTSQSWSEYRPWQKNKPQSRDFIGIVIPGNRILMLTDDLDDQTLIQVEKGDRPPRFPGRVVHCDYQIGLAVITVDEPGFFDDLQPVDMAERAGGENFYSASWNDGQLNLSAVRWSQVKVYNSGVPHVRYAGVSMVTDLRSGGWGEPVFSENGLIGISNSQTDDRAIVQPVELIRAYLNALELPEYPGFADLGFTYQYKKGPATSAYLGQEGIPTGIRICTVVPGGSVDGILKPGDVLLELDGHTIDPLGDYDHPYYGTLDLMLIASDGHYAGDVIPARILRDRKEMTVQIPLKHMPPSMDLVPQARPGVPPDYLVAGGFIFREFDEPYLWAWGNDWYSKIPYYLRCVYELKKQSQTPEQRRLIVLADVFPDEYNLGYHTMSQTIVQSVNGRPVSSIQEMEEAFNHPRDGFHIIEFLPSYAVSKVILDAETFEEATADIMRKYEIPQRIRVSDRP